MAAPQWEGEAEKPVSMPDVTFARLRNRRLDHMKQRAFTESAREIESLELAIHDVGAALVAAIYDAAWYIGERLAR